MTDDADPAGGPDPVDGSAWFDPATRPDPTGGPRPRPVQRLPVTTPGSRLLFWLRASFLGDAALAAIGGVLIVQNESAGYAVLVFTALRAGLGVWALLIAARAMDRRDPNDDRPSVIH